MIAYLQTKTTRVAYHRLEGAEPGVVFLGGFRSDMEGSKALFLEDWARQNNRAFLRFDYGGHGQSDGEFLNGCISDWSADAQDAITNLTNGPQILVGSSMGGWISCILATSIPDRIAGFIGIAAAPDFTEDSMWEGFDEAQRVALMTNGQVELPSDYSDDPYVITRKLIDDGRDNLVLRRPLPMPYPVRLLQGNADTDVDVSVAMRLFEHIDGSDVRLTLVKGADHRFSSEECLRLIVTSIEDID